GPPRIADNDGARRGSAAAVAEDNGAVSATPTDAELIIGAVADHSAYELRVVHVEEGLGGRTLRWIVVVEIHVNHPTRVGGQVGTAAAPRIVGFTDHHRPAALEGLAACELHGEHPTV